MKKILLGLIIIFGALSSYAQYRVDFGGRIGAANYLGDIGGKEQTRRNFIWDMKMQKTRWAVGGFYRYRFNKNFALNGSLTYLRIEGNDALTTNRARKGRNLSFVNDMLDVSTRGEYYFYSHDDVTGRGKYFLSMRTYAFAGLGGTIHAPKTKYNGDTYKLRKLSTEGVKYGLATVNIPLGLGVYFTYKKEHRYGFEMSWHTAFTDYLDDISTVYVDPSNLSPDAANLYNRNGELSASDAANAASWYYYGYHEDNKEIVASNGGNLNLNENKRGDATNNDNYLLATFTYSHVTLGSKANTLYRQHSSKAKYKKNVKRRIRAKF